MSLFPCIRWFMLFAGLLMSPATMAQGENDNWYFGGRAGLTFNTIPPSALNGSPIYTAEGTVSVSDSTGNLLFYSDGQTVWNRHHQPMPHGTGLLGDLSSVNAALAVRYPGLHTRYLLFTADTYSGSNGVRYSLIDLTADSGRGDVDTNRKNIRLRLRTTEKLAWVPHPLGAFGWLVGQAEDTALYYAYRVDARGIDTVATISAIGAAIGNSNGIGQLKIAPDGTLLANCHHEAPLVELFDFDVATGRLSNARSLVIPPASFGLYGLEFSGDSRKLYLGQFSPPSLYQFDLSAGSAAAINASRLLVGSSSMISLAGLQRGPDGRIYVSRAFDNHLGVVQYPDSAGPACAYADTAVGLQSGRCAYGLPTPVGLLQPPFRLMQAGACRHEPAAFSVVPAPPGVAARWDFGDPTSGVANTAVGPTASHTYQIAGTYAVTLTLDVLGSPFVLRTTVTVLPSPTLILPDTVRQCPGEAVTLTATTPSAGRFRWSTGDTTATINITTPGNYWVELISTQGCRARHTVRVMKMLLPSVLGADTMVCFEGGPTLLRTRYPLETYRWNTGDTTAAVSVNGPGTYWLKGSYQGCDVLDTVVVRAQCPLFIPNIITPNADGLNDTFVCRGFESSTVDLRIYSRWGTEIMAETNYHGTWAAENLPAGTYFYRLIDQTTGRSYKGFVEVVK